MRSRHQQGEGCGESDQHKRQPARCRRDRQPRAEIVENRRLNLYSRGQLARAQSIGRLECVNAARLDIGIGLQGKSDHHDLVPEIIRRQIVGRIKRLIIGDCRIAASRTKILDPAKALILGKRLASGHGKQGGHEAIRIAGHVAQHAIAVHRQAGNARTRPGLDQFCHGFGPDQAPAIRPVDQAFVGGENDVGSHRIGQRPVLPGIGRLGEDNVESDRPGAGRAELADQLRMLRAGPGPLLADRAHAGFVDRDQRDSGLVGQHRIDGGQIVKAAPLQIAHHRGQAQQADQQRGNGGQHGGRKPWDG